MARSLLPSPALACCCCCIDRNLRCRALGAWGPWMPGSRSRRVPCRCRVMSCWVLWFDVAHAAARLVCRRSSCFPLLYCFAVRSPIRSTLVTCIALQPRYDTGRRCSGRTHRPAPSIRRVLRCAATGSAPGSAAKSLLSGLAESSLCRPLFDTSYIRAPPVQYCMYYRSCR